MAYSNEYAIKSETPDFSNWSVQNAVKDGYKVNGWVYRAVTLIAKSAASVPWGVVNADGEFIDHYLSDLLGHPNDSISRQDVFELLISWLELAGNAYLKTVKSGNQTTELWPVSPDRLKPVLSKNISEWISGYALDSSTKVSFPTDEIIHFKYFNPASPYLGIGPLQAVCKTVDVDVDQINWNKSAMQNRGVLDGIFSFKKEFRNQDQADSIAEKINERYSGSGNARRIGVVGSEANYIRTALTPVQMDFLESRKFNRDEIFIVFGVPPQYAGTQEASTYNNYSASELIFWFQKIIPLLDDLKDTLNFFFKDELGDNKIQYNLNGIPAIRRALLERSKTAMTLYDMGIPVSQLNRIFSFGVEEFEGWEKSYPKNNSKNNENNEVDKNISKKTNSSKADNIETRKLLLEKRDIDSEINDREEYSIKKSKDIEALLFIQKKIIFDAIEKNANEKGVINYIDPEKLLDDTWVNWSILYSELMIEYGVYAAGQIVIQERAIDPEIKDAIEQDILNMKIVDTEIGHISNTTINTIALQVEQGIEEGWTVAQLQQALVDTGVMTPARALTLSRTITGTAGSLGQYVSARETGATHKKWVNSGFEVRDLHIERGMDAEVKINDRYPAKLGASIGPMYPLDIILVPADRVNCRCSQIFSIK